MESTEVTVLNDRSIRLRFENNEAIINSVRSLKQWIRGHTDIDERTAQRLGMVAGLIAVAELAESGQNMGSSNVARVLDPYYFAFDAPNLSESFSVGVGRGLSAARSGTSIEELNEMISQD